jgi:hypothetical protein
MGILFGLLNRHILLKRDHLLAREMPLEERRLILARALGGVGPYVLATILAFVSPYLTLAVCAAVAVYYSSPVASGLKRRAS